MTRSNALLALVLALNWSCGSSLLHRGISEGVIEYALSFPDYDPQGLMAGMLPEKTTLTFDENRQVAELSAGMGVFKTALVVDNKKEQGDYHLSVLSKKLVAHLQQRNIQLFNKDGMAFTILYTDQTDTIAGYPCKKAVAVYGDLNNEEIDLWYTDRIKIENPNWFGPFAEIPGVLLSYEMVQYGMRMRLDATSITAGPVDPVKFAVKPDYRSVPPEVLQHEMEEVLSTFSL